MTAKPMPISLDYVAAMGNFYGVRPAKPSPSGSGPTSLADRFRELAEEWRSSTEYCGMCAFDMANVPAYQKIIKLGRPVVPFIIAAWGERPFEHWHLALEGITGENQPAVRRARTCAEYRKAWIDWWDESQAQQRRVKDDARRMVEAVFPKDPDRANGPPVPLGHTFTADNSHLPAFDEQMVNPPMLDFSHITAKSIREANFVLTSTWEDVEPSLDPTPEDIEVMKARLADYCDSVLRERSAAVTRRYTLPPKVSRLRRLAYIGLFTAACFAFWLAVAYYFGWWV